MTPESPAATARKLANLSKFQDELANWIAQGCIGDAPDIIRPGAAVRTPPQEEGL